MSSPVATRSAGACAAYSGLYATETMPCMCKDTRCQVSGNAAPGGLKIIKNNPCISVNFRGGLKGVRCQEIPEVGGLNSAALQF